MKRITQADRLRWRMQFIMQLVLTVLDWDKQQYADFQFETGITWLKYYFSTDSDSQAIVMSSASFWAWWRMNWYFRDMEFLEGAAYRRSREIGGLDETAYESTHEARRLADVRTRWGKVLEDSYCRDMLLK